MDVIEAIHSKCDQNEREGYCDVLIEDLRELLPCRHSFTTGLCANREDHEPHLVESGSLAPYWCTADQDRREPGYSERLRAGRRAP